MHCSSQGAQVLTRDHSFTCHQHVYLQVEWAIPAFTSKPRGASQPFGRYSFPIPRG